MACSQCNPPSMSASSPIAFCSPHPDCMEYQTMQITFHKSHESCSWPSRERSLTCWFLWRIEVLVSITASLKKNVNKRMSTRIRHSPTRYPLSSTCSSPIAKIHLRVRADGCKVNSIRCMSQFHGHIALGSSFSLLTFHHNHSEQHPSIGALGQNCSDCVERLGQWNYRYTLGLGQTGLCWRFTRILVCCCSLHRCSLGKTVRPRSRHSTVSNISTSYSCISACKTKPTLE